MSADELRHQARRVEPEKAKLANADPWERARQEDAVIDGEGGDLSVRVGDGDVHDVRLVEDSTGYVGACDCDGFAFHGDDLVGSACAHILAVVREVALDDSLVASAESTLEVRSEPVDAEVVEHDPDADGDQDDVDDDRPDAGDASPDAPVEPQGRGADHAAPATPSTAPTIDVEQDVDDLDDFVSEVAGVPSVFVVDMGRGSSSKPYVTKEGLNYIARRAGIETRAEPISPSWEDDGDVAAYRGVAVDEDGRRYEDVATAHADEVKNTVGTSNLDELASTRATNRALRLATGCGFASAEELDGGMAVEATDDGARADGSGYAPKAEDTDR